jgi:hypothetical protein
MDQVYVTTAVLLWVPKVVEQAFLVGVAAATILLCLSLLLAAWMVFQDSSAAVSSLFSKTLAGLIVFLVLSAMAVTAAVWKDIVEQ